MSAFVSLVAGFSAPIAAAAKSLVRYARPFVPALGAEGARWGPLLVEDLAAIAAGVAAGRGAPARHREGFAFNDAMTLLKVIGITGIIVAAIAIGRGEARVRVRGVAALRPRGRARRAAARARDLAGVRDVLLLGVERLGVRGERAARAAARPAALATRSAPRWWSRSTSA
jgi:hypothetical protein